MPLPGFEFVKTRVDGGRGVLDRAEPAGGRLQQGGERARNAAARSSPTIAASRTSSWGSYQRPQPGNKGHYHEEGGEFWLIMLGHIRYNIEGLQEFEAEQGDVVYVPRQTWHLASFGGKEGSARAVWR